MKHIKKIFLSVLIVAMAVSALAVIASAQALEVGAGNFTDVLEYYTNTVVSESFEDLSVGDNYLDYAPGSVILGVADFDASVAVVEDAGEKALKLTGGSTTNKTGDFYFVSNVDADAEGFGVDFAYRPNEGCKKPARGTSTYGIFTIYATNANGEDVALVELNPVDKKNTLTVLQKADDGEGGFINAPTVVEGVSIKNNVHYEVSYYYSFEENKFTLTVTAIGAELVTGGNTITYTGSYTEPLALASVKGGFAANNWYNATNINYIYSYRAYNGSFAQFAVCEKVHDKVGEYIVDAAEIFADANTTTEQKSAIVEAVAEIVGTYGFVTTDATVAATVDSILLDAQKVWGANFVSAMPNLNTSAAYADRVAFVESISKFYNVIVDKTEIEGIDTAALAAAKEAYATELVTLENIDADSKAIVVLMNGVVLKNLNYITLGEYKVAIEALEYADPTYSEASFEAVSLATDVLLRYEEVCQTNSAFIENVAVMQTATAFGAKYSAYAIARDSYEKLDAAYPNIAAAIAEYDAYDKTGIIALAAQFDALIAEIAKASYTTTFSATQTFIDSATLLFDNAELEAVDFDYPEMDYYTELYNSLRDSQIAKKAAADAYIAAVNAIKPLTKFDDIKAAIATAQALKATGNVNGITGVDEANVYLSAKYTEIVCYEGYSKLYIETVNAVKDAATLAERRALLIEAASYVDGTYADYNGVAAAKTEYAAQFAAYNEAVKAANAAFETVVTTAAEAVASPATANLNKVALVVKKIFE